MTIPPGKKLSNFSSKAFLFFFFNELARDELGAWLVFIFVSDSRVSGHLDCGGYRS